MVYSFLRAATDALDDPVFKKAGAHEPLGKDRSGKPLVPNEFSHRVAKMNQADVSKLVASTCVAVTNIGCAYEHAFKLLHHIETGSNPQSSDEGHLGLDRLYDLLPQGVQSELDAVYVSVKSHEFSFEEKFDNRAPWTEQSPGVGSTRFRQSLNYWESANALRSHTKYADAELPFEAEILIPMRSLEIVDRILAELLAPRLELRYTRMIGQHTTEDKPEVKWADGHFKVSIPDMRGRIIDASWKPGVTSIIRIREIGKTEWSVGFETPLDSCGFVDLKPDVPYEAQVTLKNDEGEGPPVRQRILVPGTKS